MGADVGLIVSTGGTWFSGFSRLRAEWVPKARCGYLTRITIKILRIKKELASAVWVFFVKKDPSPTAPPKTNSYTQTPPETHRTSRDRCER